MNTKNTLPLFAIILVGALLAFLILRTGKTSRGNDPPEGQGEARKEAAPKGPHGGRLLSREDFQIEMTIYEKGVPPQFRVYPYKKGKPIDPAEVQLTVTLHRLGGRVDEIRFQKEGDYLRGDRVIEEPHSFDLQVVSKQGDQIAEWQYAQIEGRVEMTPEVAKASGIEIGTAGPVRMKTVLALPGEIGLNRNKMAQIVPRVSGVVTDVRKNLSDPVKKGEIIVLLDSRELAAAKSDYIESLHRLEFAQATFVREESLWKKKISAEEDYLLARHRLEEAEIAKQVTEQKLLALGVTPAELT
ncbi:MAG: efflux RND transporter periplasmic adaptor subunit, partial [Candidatus Manganitrophaceae bacterium]